MKERDKTSLDDFEFEVYAAKGVIERAAFLVDGVEITASNREIAQLLSTDEEPISRNIVGRARNSLRQKLGFKAGW